ncbi:MAG: anthranilate phosphoribosyltransferase [Candidatus Jacksonbacteria bacterium]
MSYEKLIKKLADKKNLGSKEMTGLMNLLLGARVNDIQKTALVLALKLKGETDLEISQAAKIMRRSSVKISIKNPLIDVCGTGGSGLGKLNISTACAFVLASLGARVLKHGNRAATSKCGSFDLLEALGAKIELKSQQVKKIFQKLNIGFVFAPLYHPIMKNVILVRKNLAVPTIFNLIGPLCNPASPAYQVIGTSKFEHGEKLINALKTLGLKRAMVLFGEDGMDEASICAATNVWELDQNKKVKHYKIQPEDFGLKRAEFNQIKGGDKKYNKNKILDLFSGKLKGAPLDFLCLNAACGLYVYGTVKNLKQGIDLAKQAVVSGQTFNLMDQYIELSRRV